MSYRVRGDYFESCNCEAICPCRMIGGIPGGRSTYGVCYGLLSWAIAEGAVEGVDVSGLAVALVYEYSDDEPGSPWSLVLHVDARAVEDQHAALERLFLHELRQLPWIRKARNVVAVRSSPIEIDGLRVQIGAAIALSASRPVETDQPVACIVPGYDRVGQELYADELRVNDGPFSFALEGNCAYAADFDYASS